MTYQFICCIETRWTFIANVRLHSFMSKYVLGWCLVIVDTPWHPHCQFQSLPQMNSLHIHTITNNNHMQTVTAVQWYNTQQWLTCSNVSYETNDEQYWCMHTEHAHELIYLRLQKRFWHFHLIQWPQLQYNYNQLHPIVWYKCASLRMWFLIPYYHKILICAVLERWLWNWVQSFLFNICGFIIKFSQR